MKTYMLKYLENFQCDSTKCQNSCCVKYGNIRVDENTVELYREKAPELLSHVSEETDKYFLKINEEDNSCPLLNNGRCSIQQEYGLEFQPEICHTYPRVFTRVKEDLFVTSYFPCNLMMEAALFTENSFDWTETELSRLPALETNIYSQEHADLDFLNLFKFFVRLVDDKSFNSEETIIRLLLIGDYIKDLQVKYWPSITPKVVYKLVDKNKVTSCYYEYNKKYTDDKCVYEFMYSLLVLVNIRHKELDPIINDILNLIEDIDTHNVREIWEVSSQSSPLDTILKSYIKARLSQFIFPMNCVNRIQQELIFLASSYYFVRLALILNFNKLNNYTDKHSIACIIAAFEDSFYGRYFNNEEIYNKHQLMDTEKAFCLMTRGYSFR